MQDLGDMQNLEHQESLGDDEDTSEQVYLSKDAIEERKENEQNGDASKQPKELSFISIPELQATIWTQSEFLRHFLTISALLDDAEKWKQINAILSCKDLYSSRSSLLYALQYVLLFLNSSFDYSKYD